MNIIVYEGPHLDMEQLRLMARSTAQLFDTEDIDLNVRTCGSEDELPGAMKEIAMLEVQDKERFYPFRTVGGIQLLRLSQVLYFKSCGHRVTAVLTDGRELLGRTLRVPTSTLLAPLVQSGQFYRTYRSTFVNKCHITQMGPTWVKLDNGTCLTVSRKYYNLLLEQDKLKGM